MPQTRALDVGTLGAGERLIAVLRPARRSLWPRLCRECRREGNFTSAPSGLCAVHRWRRDAEGVDLSRLFRDDYKRTKTIEGKRSSVPRALDPDFPLNPCRVCGDPIQPFKVSRRSTAKGQKGELVKSWCTPAIYARKKTCSEHCMNEQRVRVRREHYEEHGQPDFGKFARRAAFHRRKWGEPDRE